MRREIGVSVTIRLIMACLGAACLSSPARSQTTGVISGRALTIDGRPVRGFIVLQPQPVLGSHARLAPPQRAFSDAKGAFQFVSLAAGKYALCASPLPNQGRNRQEVLVDGCEWRQLQPVTLAAGQTLSSITLTVAAGRLFQVHVNDPGHSLAQNGRAPSETSPAAPDPQLVVLLKGQDRLLHHVPATARTFAGRDHSLIVPNGVAFSVIVRSKEFRVLDDAGKPFTGELPVAATGGPSAAINVTVNGVRP